MKIQDIQSAEAELSFHWRLLPVTARQKRQFVISFLEAVEVNTDEAHIRAAFYSNSRERINLVIWFMIAQFVFNILVEWWKTRDA